jgi:AraC-like DNA-binding protein
VDGLGEAFELQVRKKMVWALQEGDPSAEAIAKTLHMSARSLHRRLKQEGVVFRDVLKDVRMNLAKRYLNEQKMTLPETALMLGYSEQSAFTRAFKSWFGVTPSQYLQRH